MLALYEHWGRSEAAAPDFREIFWTFKQCLSLFRSELAGGRCRFSVSERLKKTKCEMLPPPPHNAVPPPAAWSQWMLSCDAAMPAGLKITLRSPFRHTRYRCASAIPTLWLMGTRFSRHLILLLSELSGPKTIINSHSSVNPLTRSFHSSWYRSTPTFQWGKEGRAMGKKCGHSNGSQENTAGSHQHTRS